MIKKIILISLLILSNIEADSLANVEETFAQGNFPKLYEQTAKLLETDSANEELNFYHGLSSFALGKYKEAISAFDAVLIMNEENHRARLELARTYLALNMFEASQAEFEKVLSQNPPKEVVQNIKKFLESIESRKKKHFWQIILSLGFGDDSNINSSATGDDLAQYMNEIFPGISVTMTSDIEALYFNEGLSVFHTYKPRDKDSIEWQSSFQFINQNHKDSSSSTSESDYDYLFYKLSTGPVFIQKSYKIELPFIYSEFHLNSKKILSVYGIEPKYSYLLNKNIILSCDLNINKKKYNNATYRDVDFYGIGAKIEFSKVNHNLKARFFKSSEEKKNESINSFVERDTLSMLFAYSYKYDTYLFSLLQNFTENKFNDIISTSTELRKDKFSTSSLNISKQMTDKMNVGAYYTYNKSSSNYTPAKYDKSVVGVQLSYSLGGEF